MRPTIRLSRAVQETLRCPVCRTKLSLLEERFTCAEPECGARLPVVDGIPVLINEENSLFRVDDFVSRRATTHNPPAGRIKRALCRLVPTTSVNVKARRNYRKFADLLLAQSTAPRVLVVGGGFLGQGMKSLARHRSLELVETDVFFGPRTRLVCDVHDLPFEDESFDGVIAQAVLEHVIDPYRTAEEIHRVLKRRGLVYAETPFMWQVHFGPYDFTRFTHLGHRRLFRRFEEVESGAVCGPGVALALAYEHFLLSFARWRILRALIRAFARLTSFHLKFFDYLLINRPGTLDAASGLYFMGRKADHVLPDRELIRLYRGLG